MARRTADFLEDLVKKMETHRDHLQEMLSEARQWETIADCRGGKIERLKAEVARLDSVAQTAIGKNMKLAVRVEELEIENASIQGLAHTAGARWDRLRETEARCEALQAQVANLTAERDAMQKIVDAAHGLSISLHTAEADGIVLPGYVDDAWSQFTEADQAALKDKP